MIYNDYFEESIIHENALLNGFGVFKSFYDYECCRQEYIDFENEEQPNAIDEYGEVYAVCDEQAVGIELELDECDKTIYAGPKKFSRFILKCIFHNKDKPYYCFF